VLKPLTFHFHKGIYCGTVAQIFTGAKMSHFFAVLEKSAANLDPYSSLKHQLLVHFAIRFPLFWSVGKLGWHLHL
jgi:hypothetical protein